MSRAPRHIGPVTPWTDQENEFLANMAEAGASGGQMAKALGKTRSAVMGRLRRIGLKLRNKAGWPAVAKPVSVAAKRTKQVRGGKPNVIRMSAAPVRAFVAPKVDPGAPVPRLVALMDLQPHDCRWPSEGVGEHTRFCGHARDGASSWCPYHHRLVYVPIERRKAAA